MEHDTLVPRESKRKGVSDREDKRYRWAMPDVGTGIE